VTYKASEDFIEEMNEAGTISFDYGYDECLGKISVAFPDLDLSFL